LNRLIEAGDSEEKAKRLIGCVVSAEIFDILKRNELFNLDGFVKALDKLLEISWAEQEG